MNKDKTHGSNGGNAPGVRSNGNAKDGKMPRNDPQKHEKNIRALALTILLDCERAGQYSNIALDLVIKKNDLSDADRALLTRLVFGVIERQVTLDYYIDTLSSLPPSKIEPITRYALRLGLYQLRYSDKIPDFAAVNESVALVPRRAAGFVNALLREYLRRGDRLPLPSAKNYPDKHLAVKYSFPAPLCGRFIEIFGAAGAENILEAFCTPPRLTLRVNTLRTDRQTLLKAFADKGIECSPTTLSPVGIILDSMPPASLPGFSEGLFFVQDESSQLCALSLGAQRGDCVVDTCSAPGSKSFGIALSMENGGELYSFDLHENKLSLINSGAARLGIDIIKTSARDGKNPDDALFGTADRVLCDVPCSGYGVMAKKPEIRHKKLDLAAGLPEIQYEILEKSAQYLKAGGVLVYSTCTLLPEENEEVVRRFIDSHPDFTLTPFTAGELDVPDGMITLTPAEHKTDGFFMARMQMNRKDAKQASDVFNLCT